MTTQRKAILRNAVLLAILAWLLIELAIIAATPLPKTPLDLSERARAESFCSHSPRRSLCVTLAEQALKAGEAVPR